MSSLHRPMPKESSLLSECVKKGLRMTTARRVIALVLEQSKDHPDVQEVHRRVCAQNKNKNISLATTYRTLRLFHEIGALDRHAFAADKIKNGAKRRWRYEPCDKHGHYHLIDVKSGKVIEFENDEMAKLQKNIARKLGYRLDSHRTELYGISLGRESGRRKAAKK